LKIFYSIQSFYEKNPAARTSVMVGNFDGQHIGHQKLSQATLNYANEKDLQTLALTFSPHPQSFFQKKPLGNMIFTPDQKVEAFSELGFDFLIVQDFNSDFSAITREYFYSHYLLKLLGARSVTVGDNFKFGTRRAGDTSYLTTSCLESSINCQIIGAVEYESAVVSSSYLRGILKEQGDVSLAATLLGRPFSIDSQVCVGKKIGRTINFPTANLLPNDQLKMKTGVYAANVWIEDFSKSTPTVLHMPENLYQGVVNVGLRPTISDNTLVPVTEVHIYSDNFPEDSLYGKKIRLFFLKRLRDEMKFADKDALCGQIIKDIQSAKK